MESRTAQAENPPRLMDVCLDLVEDIVALLRAVSPDDPVADSIADLPFHGVRDGYVLTAPLGSPTPTIIQVEQGDEVAFLLGFDPSRSLVICIDVLDGRELPDH
jgi:hypothetical protein